MEEAFVLNVQLNNCFSTVNILLLVNILSLQVANMPRESHLHETHFVIVTSGPLKLEVTHIIPIRFVYIVIDN